ncbi:MAG TPA: hypothetical protein PLW81_13330 [Thiobacillaceae bacterium]|nr:hypothetical protein [Thiobacillaceae bacterium]
MKKILILALLLVLAGCAVWQRVDNARAEAPDKSYTVDLPLGWVRLMLDSQAIALTRDGFALNRIYIQRLDLAKAFPQLKKHASAELLPSELAEQQIAEAKTAAKETVLTVLENAPTLVGGQPGYRLRLQQRNPRGLALDRVIYGCATAKGYFTLTYEAPALHYAARNLPEFEKTVASFRLAAN